MRKLLFIIFFCLVLVNKAFTQVLALKTNLAADVVLSPNMSLELKLGSRFTLDLSGHYNPFYAKESLHRWRYWLVQPEFRIWGCEPFFGHFWGIHFLLGEYNISSHHLPFGLYRGTRNGRYEGFVAGAGISYGYHWILSPRWGIEMELGAGYVRAGYHRYRCVHCGEETNRGHKYYMGPTKVAVSLVYLLK